MPTSTDVTNLKINQLTEAQYDTAVQGGVIGANELSILTDAEAGQVIQVDTLPTASVDELGKIYQFIGTTTGSYTNGYFYKCVSDGAVTPTYSWSRVDVQPQGDSLPSQSGQSGKYLTTNGTSASWATISALQNNATQSDGLSILGSASTYYGVVSIGTNSQVVGNYGVAIGKSTKADYDDIAIGDSAQVKATGGHNIAIGAGAIVKTTYQYHGTIQIGNGTNTTAGTMQVSLPLDPSSPYGSNGNYILLETGGTIPTDRFTSTPSADGTYVPTLTISSGVATRSWAAPGGGGSVPTLTWYTVLTAGSTLTIADTSSAQLVKIYKNGLLLEPTADYSISGTTLTMVTALVVGDKITTEVF